MKPPRLTAVGMVRLSQKAARLRGYLLRPLRDGRRVLVVNLRAFCKVTFYSYRTAQAALAELRRLDPQFSFETVRIGRSFRVRVSLRTPLYSSGGSSLRKNDKMQTRTAPRAACNVKRPASPGVSVFYSWERTDQAKTSRKAAWIARQLAAEHWTAGADDFGGTACRIRYEFGHAWNYARRALGAGFAAVAVIEAYKRALNRCNEDAASQAEFLGARFIAWAPSSTVTRAAAMLEKWGRAETAQKHAA
jgi:hypothetical protein